MNFDHMVKEWENFTTQEIKNLIKEKESELDLDNKVFVTEEEIHSLFGYLQLLIYDRRLEPMIIALQKTKPHILSACGQNPENENLLLYLIEWYSLAMRFILPETEKVAEYRYYVELKDICKNKGDQFILKGLIADISLLNYYLNWQKAGGVDENLPEDQLETIQYLLTNWEANLIDQVNKWLEFGADDPQNYSRILNLRRSQYRYYLVSKKPNEAIAILKEMLELAPKIPEFIETDSADIFIEIALIFFGFKKYKTSKMYFEKAHLIYSKSGSEYELLAAQAESYIGECQKKM